MAVYGAAKYQTRGTKQRGIGAVRHRGRKVSDGGVRSGEVSGMIRRPGRLAEYVVFN